MCDPWRINALKLELVTFFILSYGRGGFDTLVYWYNYTNLEQFFKNSLFFLSSSFSIFLSAKRCTGYEVDKYILMYKVACWSLLSSSLRAYISKSTPYDRLGISELLEYPTSEFITRFIFFRFNLLKWSKMADINLRNISQKTETLLNINIQTYNIEIIWLCKLDLLLLLLLLLLLMFKNRYTHFSIYISINKYIKLLSTWDLL